VNNDVEGSDSALAYFNTEPQLLPYEAERLALYKYRMSTEPKSFIYKFLLL
jgi:hypothetical protein